MPPYYNRQVTSSQRFENEHVELSRVENFSAKLYINIFHFLNKIFYLRIKWDIHENFKIFRISDTSNNRVATDRIDTNTSKYLDIQSQRRSIPIKSPTQNWASDLSFSRQLNSCLHSRHGNFWVNSFGLFACRARFHPPLCSKAAQDGDYSQFANPRLERNYNQQEIARMAFCAAAAIRHSTRRRPKMSQIVRALEGDTSIEDLSKGGRARGMARAHSKNHKHSMISTFVIDKEEVDGVKFIVLLFLFLRQFNFLFFISKY
ncbi:hypothetical protein YC2023_051656 [Brassica napus]